MTKHKEVTDSRTYRIITNKKIHNYCYICQKRTGSYYANCSRSGSKAKGYHGDGRYIYCYKARSYKTWKYNRKKQYMKKKTDML